MKRHIALAVLVLALAGPARAAPVAVPGDYCIPPADLKLGPLVSCTQETGEVKETDGTYEVIQKCSTLDNCFKDCPNPEKKHDPKEFTFEFKETYEDTRTIEYTLDAKAGVTITAELSAKLLKFLEGKLGTEYSLEFSFGVHWTKENKKAVELKTEQKITVPPCAWQTVFFACLIKSNFKMSVPITYTGTYWADGTKTKPGDPQKTAAYAVTVTATGNTTGNERTGNWDDGTCPAPKVAKCPTRKDYISMLGGIVK